jgi:hypothetical protein
LARWGGASNQGSFGPLGGGSNRDPSTHVEAHAAHYGKLYVRTRSGYDPKPQALTPRKTSVAEETTTNPQ